MFILGIILLIFAVGLLVVVITSNDDDLQVGTVIGFVMIVCLILGIVLIIENVNPSITPMDVYKGKTTLEYKVVDGEKVDSIVVWKNDKED